VASNILPAKVFREQKRKRRFVKEAKAAALNHPQVISVHEIGETNFRYFIATEFLDSETTFGRQDQTLIWRENGD
jgi:hypothetical protein